MSSESVCQVARSWVDVERFYTRLVVMFMNFTASFRNILDKSSYSGQQGGHGLPCMHLLCIRL
jgi:hypothetical protein